MNMAMKAAMNPKIVSKEMIANVSSFCSIPAQVAKSLPPPLGRGCCRITNADMLAARSALDAVFRFRLCHPSLPGPGSGTRGGPAPCDGLSPAPFVGGYRMGRDPVLGP